MPKTETDIEKRNKYGMLCGIVGIFLNLIFLPASYLQECLAVQSQSLRMHSTTCQMQVHQSSR